MPSASSASGWTFPSAGPSNPPRSLQRALLVSVHDVTPAHEDRIARVLALLAEFGVARYALLVVPEWHGAWPLAAHPDFTGLLAERQRAGAEILQHGLRHDEIGSRRELRHHLRAWGRTDREAEFLPLTEEDARRRVDRGTALLRAVGLDPVGFVPPAWFHGHRLHAVLRARGLAITEDAFSVIRLSDGRRFRAPAVQWSTRKRWRAAVGIGIAVLRRPFDRPRSLLRFAIHPPDIESPAVAASLRASLAALLAERRAISYREAVASA